MGVKYIIINKNRGWRGLAEAKIIGNEHERISERVFSFSQDVWDDMQRGMFVVQDYDNYHVLYFNNTEILPKGQRSVLIKSFEAEVYKVNTYHKGEWMKAENIDDYRAINHFIKNRNNHTTSDWNYIGIRVTPMI